MMHKELNQLLHSALRSFAVTFSSSFTVPVDSHSVVLRGKTNKCGQACPYIYGHVLYLPSLLLLHCCERFDNLEFYPTLAEPSQMLRGGHFVP